MTKQPFDRGGNRLHHVLPGAEDVRICADDLELIGRLQDEGGYVVEVLQADCPDETYDIKFARITKYYIDRDERKRAFTVDIWRDDMPAQFWCFWIQDFEGRAHKITTGSGSLSKYWATVELVGGAMWEQEVWR